MTVALITSRRSTQYNADPPRANNVAILILVGSLALGGLLTFLAGHPLPIIVCAIVGGVLMQSPRIAQTQAAPEKQARIILGEGELAIAHSSPKRHWSTRTIPPRCSSDS